MSFGDASTLAGGFLSHTHKFWSSLLIWSPETIRRLDLKNKHERIHINQLEMLVHISQLVAVIVALEDPTIFPANVKSIWEATPPAPIWLSYVDNKVSEHWNNKRLARSVMANI